MQTDILTYLAADDYYIDSDGRLVIENNDLLKLITGALGNDWAVEMMTDVGCSNSGCGS